MNIQAINPAFGTRSNAKTDKLDAFINMDDNHLRQLAYAKSAEEFNEKKSRRVTNALFYAAPLAAGVKAAAFNDGSATKIFSKKVSGLAGRAARGLKVAALFTAGLAALDTMGVGVGKLINKSDKVKNLYNDHPFLSLGALVGAGLGVIALLNRGAGRLAAVKAPKFLQKGTAKVAKFLNTNKHIAKAQNAMKGLAAKTPAALKEFGVSALEWAPTALLLGGLFHSVSDINKKNRVIAKNYTQLRNFQSELTKQRVNQLVAENDSLNALSDDEEEFVGII